VFLSNQDPASYPTFFVTFTLIGQIGDPLSVFDIRLPSRHGFDMLRIDHKSFKTADPSG